MWIVGLTNSFNLMDNMDGAASAVAAVCAAGLALQSLVRGDVALAALAVALAGACVGFLPYNLRAGAPVRIFLGDGGSMPIGFIVAAIAMNIPVGEQLGWTVLLVAALLLAIPMLATLLVVVSRTRRGVSIVTAGRDHLTKIGALDRHQPADEPEQHLAGATRTGRGAGPPRLRQAARSYGDRARAAPRGSVRAERLRAGRDPPPSRGLRRSGSR
jgi:UDP-N-acetylmuramyl pentapeptide phosphotransferase/UDP-N-acetylglucosamine-1-phosphate transferase